MFKFKKRFRSPEVLRCSFCNKPQDRVKKVITNPDEMPVRVYICNECVAVCNSILEDDKKTKMPK